MGCQDLTRRKTGGRIFPIPGVGASVGGWEAFRRARSELLVIFLSSHGMPEPDNIRCQDGFGAKSLDSRGWSNTNWNPAGDKEEECDTG